MEKQILRKKDTKLSEVTGVPNIERNAVRIEAKVPTPDIFYHKEATAGLVAQAEQLMMEEDQIMQGIQVDEGDDSDFEKNSNVRLKTSANRKDRTASSEKQGNDKKKSDDLSKSNPASANDTPSRGRTKKDYTGTLAKYEEELKNDHDKKGTGSTIIKRNNNFMNNNAPRGGSLPASVDDSNKLEDSGGNTTSIQPSQPVPTQSTA